MAETVKVHGIWGSPFSRRVEIALKLKGVDYEYIEEDLSSKSSLLLEYNPIHKKVPVIVHNGKPLAESTIILEYIDETWKQNPILPENPHARAMARFWAKYIDDKCMPTLWKACWADENEREKCVEEGLECLETLENELKKMGTRFFGGNEIGFVDIVADFIGFWLGVCEEASGNKLLTKEAFPTLHKWTEEFVDCELFNQNLPSKDRLFAFLQARVDLPSSVPK